MNLARLRRLASVGLAATFVVLGAVAPASAQDDISALDDFTPDGCWSDDARIEPATDSGNVVLYPQWKQAPSMVIDEGATYYAILSTNKGDMTFELNTGAAPTTVNNFICLATNDYYDVTPFHRVIAGFMIQGGDPTGTGAGGPGYSFNDELPGDDLDYQRGTLAMANAGPNTQGSQFFIMHADANGGLQKDYTIFGQLIDGDSVLDDIADTTVVANPRGEPSVPVEFIVIKDVTIKVAP